MEKRITLYNEIKLLHRSDEILISYRLSMSGVGYYDAPHLFVCLMGFK